MVATDAILIDRGDTLSFTGTWTDEKGVALNLTGCTIAISEASPDSVKDEASVTITDAVHGTFQFRMDADLAEKAFWPHRWGYVRLAITSPNGDVDATPMIGIKVQ